MSARPTLIAAALLLAACGKHPPPEPPADAGGSSENTKVFIYDTELPVPADYEDDAAASIDETTYKSDLDALAKEIGGG